MPAVLPEQQPADGGFGRGGREAACLDATLTRCGPEQPGSTQVEVPQVAAVRGVDLQSVPQREGAVAERVVPDPRRCERRRERLAHLTPGQVEEFGGFQEPMR